VGRDPEGEMLLRANDEFGISNAFLRSALASVPKEANDFSGP
jgi:hypothetical protein